MYTNHNQQNRVSSTEYFTISLCGLSWAEVIKQQATSWCPSAKQQKKKNKSLAVNRESDRDELNRKQLG